MCQTTAMDEVLSTLKIFKRALKVTRMNWADAAYNFLNCLGPILQMKLGKLVADYPVTENGFNQMVRGFIRELCLDKSAKGTLKQSIKRGAWIKPEGTEI